MELLLNLDFKTSHDLKAYYHAIWQLYKKLGVFASIEFKN